MRSHSPASAAVIAVLVVARPGLDAQTPVARGGWRGERIPRGDTTVVRTVSGSVWGPRPELVEELRIGELDGPAERSFGWVIALAVGRDGSIYLFDQTVPALRQFDASGKYVRTLGRDGAGPGEYRDQVLGILVDRGGVLYLYDPRNGRINRYDPSGAPLTPILHPGTLFTSSQNIATDTAGRIYVKVLTEPVVPGRPWRFGFLAIHPERTRGDTLRVPAFDGGSADPGPFDPQGYFALSPLGYLVTTTSGRYALDLHRGAGAVTRIEGSGRQVRLRPEERAEWKAYLEFWNQQPGRQARGARAPSLPETKPFFRGIMTDEDGRIWVQLFAEAKKDPSAAEPRLVNGKKAPVITWTQDPVYDVFGPDGAYYGRLAFPPKVGPMVARGDQVWGVATGESGENYVVRYRVRGRN